MFKIKPYLVLVVLLGAGLLLYATTFLSVKVAPLPEGRSSGQLMITILESITAVVVLLAAAFGCLYYFMKSRFDHPSKH